MQYFCKRVFTTDKTTYRVYIPQARGQGRGGKWGARGGKVTREETGALLAPDLTGCLICMF